MGCALGYSGDLEIRDALAPEIREAVGVMVRAFRDNPMTQACFGPNPATRERALRSLFGNLFPTMHRPLLVSLQNGRIVGVLGMAAPGTCLQVPLLPSLRVLLVMALRSPRAADRFRRWMGEFEHLDPPAPHWHLGPVAVEPQTQRQGIGSALLERFAAIVDDDGRSAYLETDKAENVRLYRAFGFEVVCQRSILGVPNWFMSRPPAYACRPSRS